MSSEDTVLKNSILEAFRKNPRTTRKELALILDITEQDAIKLVHELVNEGLIYREKPTGK